MKRVIGISTVVFVLVCMILVQTSYSIMPKRLGKVLQGCPKWIKLSAENIDFVWNLQNENKTFLLELESACYPGLMETKQVRILEDWVSRGHTLWILFNPLRHEVSSNQDWAVHFGVKAFLSTKAAVVTKKEGLILPFQGITSGVKALQLGTPRISPAYYSFEGDLIPIVKDRSGRVVFGIKNFGSGHIVFDGFGWLFFETEKDWIDPTIYDSLVFWVNFFRWAGACVYPHEVKKLQMKVAPLNCPALERGLKSRFPGLSIKAEKCPGGGCILHLGRVLFDTGKAELRKKGKKLLMEIGKIIKEHSGYYVKIEGHTDPRPIHGRLKKKYPSNWELSRARAKVVYNFFREVGKIPEKRMKTAWYGAKRPIAPNNTAEGMQLNRRTEIILSPNPNF